MSMLLAIVSSTVQAVATATPVVAATPVPSVAADPTFVDTLNKLASNVSQTDIIAIAAALTVALQAALNKIPFFKHAVKYVQDVRRFVLAVFVPSLVTFGAGLATGSNDMHLTPVVFLGAQVIFYIAKYLIGKAVGPEPVVTSEYVNTANAGPVVFAPPLSQGATTSEATPGQQF